MGSQDGVSLIEYARSNGVSLDYLEEDPGLHLDFLHSLLNETLTSKDLDIQEIPIPSVDLYLVTKEKLTLDASARRLLSFVANLKDAPTVLDLPDRQRPGAKSLKLETPLLRTDHELDYMKALQRIGSDGAVYAFRPMPTDDEKGEGLVWPTSYGQLKHKFNEACRTLQNGQDTQANIIATDLAYSKNAALEPLTSPLLPFTSEKSLPSISSSDLPFPLLSRNTISLSDELNSLEGHLFNGSPLQASLQAHDCRNQSEKSGRDLAGCLFPNDGSFTYALPSFSPQRTKREDLKIDGPLTPPNISRPLEDITFSDAAMDSDLLFSPIAKETGTNSDEDYYAFLDQIELFGREANQILEHEQLQIADTVGRVKVPTLPSQANLPAWKLRLSKPLNEQDVQEVTLPIARMGMHHWKGIAKVERELPWSPFPMDLARVAVNEKIDHANNLASLLLFPDPKNPVDSDNLTWKPEGLRILNDVEEDEEDLQIAPTQQHPSENAQQNRTQELDNYYISQSMMAKEPLNRASTVSRLQAHTPSVTRLELPIQNDASKSNLKDVRIFSNAISASQKLDMFMDLRRGRVPKRPKLEGEFSPATGSECLSASTTTTKYDTDRAKRLQTQFQSEPSASNLQPNLLLPPELPADLPPRSIVISIHLLTHQRSFVRTLAALYPNVEMIERDLSRIPIQQPKEPQGTVFTSDEADITISPGTGILITNLQKIKQQPLPGQSSHRPCGKDNTSQRNIRDRLTNIAPKYQRLHVLVYRGNISSASIAAKFDAPDMAALLDLVLFTTSLGTGITVDFVPGEESSLARWVTCLIASTLLPASMEGVKLLTEETLWEVFLRRAGMNAYGAQAVLAKLKPSRQRPRDGEETAFPEGEEEDKRSEAYGLPAFVSMTANERIKNFERLMDGKEILERVNEALDVSWN